MVSSVPALGIYVLTEEGKLTLVLNGEEKGSS